MEVSSGGIERGKVYRDRKKRASFTITNFI